MIPGNADATLDALLRAVIADPADDGPRLAWADRLEELGGGARAEFCRVQVELAGYESPKRPGVVVCEGEGPRARAGPRKRCGCRPCALRRRGRGLLAAHALTWADAALGVCVWAGHEGGDTLVAGVEFGEARLTFRRGFVASVTLTCADFLAHAAALFACQPVEWVTLTDKEPLDDSGVEEYFDPPPPPAPVSYYWIDSDEPWLPWELPRRLRVPGGPHSSIDAAQAALSAACCAYGRAEARGR